MYKEPEGELQGFCNGCNEWQFCDFTANSMEAEEEV